jgi:hypothetical protein
LWPEGIIRGDPRAQGVLKLSLRVEIGGEAVDEGVAVVIVVVVRIAGVAVAVVEVVEVGRKTMTEIIGRTRRYWPETAQGRRPRRWVGSRRIEVATPLP